MPGLRLYEKRPPDRPRLGRPEYTPAWRTRHDRSDHRAANRAQRASADGSRARGRPRVGGTLRWDGQWSTMLFHPRPDRPTEPNAGLVRYEPGAHHPRHQHDFAQVWYIVEGEFRIGGRGLSPRHDALLSRSARRGAAGHEDRRGACSSCSIQGPRRAAGRSTTAASTCRLGARIRSAWTSDPRGPSPTPMLLTNARIYTLDAGGTDRRHARRARRTDRLHPGDGPT